MKNEVGREEKFQSSFGVAVWVSVGIIRILDLSLCYKLDPKRREREKEISCFT